MIVTKDEDFHVRRLLAADGPALVWIRIGNCSNRALLEWFMPIVDQVAARLAAGDTIVELQ